MTDLAEAATDALAEHLREDGYAGDGYTEPREAWISCSCGAQVWHWQQFYFETDEDPAVAWTDHLTWVAANNYLSAGLGEGETCELVDEWPWPF